MDMQACTEALRAKVGDSSGLNASLKFDCGADGVAYIDGKSIPNTVHNENKDADCTIAISLENLAALL
jgi:putative sterol carrier protein